MTRAHWLWLNVGIGFLAYGMALAAWAAWGMEAVIGAAIFALILGTFAVAALEEEDKTRR